MNRKEKLDEILRSAAYRDATNPRHARAVHEAECLFRAIEGEKLTFDPDLDSLADLLQSPAYLDANDPGHKEAVDKAKGLFELLDRQGRL